MSSQNKPIRDQINTVSANLESGPPPQYEHFIKARINPNDALPPTYESLYSKFKSAQRSLRQNVEQTSNIYSLNQNNSLTYSKCLAIFIMVIVFICIPITHIVLGTIYRDQCRLNSAIPLWLVINGIFMLLLAFSFYMMTRFDCSICGSIITLFLISWLIRGSAWVYGYHSLAEFENEYSPHYCNFTVYSFAFWSVTIAWSFFALIILYACYSFCCKSKITNSINY